MRSLSSAPSSNGDGHPTQGVRSATRDDAISDGDASRIVILTALAIEASVYSGLLHAT